MLELVLALYLDATFYSWLDDDVELGTVEQLMREESTMVLGSMSVA